MLSQTLVACDPDGEGLLVAARHLGVIRAYGADGGERWTLRDTAFRPMSLIERVRDDGRAMVSVNDTTYDQFSFVAVTSTRDLVVSLSSVTRSSEGAPTIGDYRFFRVSLKDGGIRFVGSSEHPMLAAFNELFVLSEGAEYPKLAVYQEGGSLP